MRTDVCLEVVRVPLLTEQLSDPVDCGGGGLTLSQHHTLSRYHTLTLTKDKRLVTRRRGYVGVVLLSEEVVSERSDVCQCVEHHVHVVIGLEWREIHSHTLTPSHPHTAHPHTP